MRLGQVTYKGEVEQTAMNFQNCAVAFFNSGFTTAPQGCVITPLAEPWPEPVPPAPDAARFVSQSATPSAAVAPASTFNETVIFANSGGIPWVGLHTMSIAASAQTGVQVIPAQSFPVGSPQSPVNSAQTVQEVFSVVAPSVPGTYDLAFVLRDATNRLLAASPTQQIVVGSPGSTVDNAELTIVSAPGSLPNGGAGNVTVTAKNTGTTTWSAPTYLLQLSRGLRLSLPQTTASVTGSVMPGASQTLTFGVICNGQGQGSFTAQMAGNQSGAFGQRVARTIVCQ